MHSRTNDQNAGLFVSASKQLPHARVDALSHVLTWVRLRGEAVVSDHLACFGERAVAQGPGRFYLVQKGMLDLHIAGAPRQHLQRGDLVLLPHGIAHVLSASGDGTDADGPDGSDGSDDGAMRFVGGCYRFDGGALPPVLTALPDIIMVAANAGDIPPWLSAITHFLLEESADGEAGSDLMVSRLVDLLVIRALRSWATSGGGRFGRLAGLSDERVAMALNALHGTPYRRWTVIELARAAAMSRSGFAERFTAVVGESPLRYLARWRLHMASEMLDGGGLRVGEVAQRVGYSSDAAFSRAFKACFGHRPGERRPAAALLPPAQSKVR